MGGSCEGGKVSTHLKDPLRGETVGGEGGKLWSHGGEHSKGCGGQSGEIPAQRISADQHSPAREACLLTRRDGQGLGAKAQASVGSQGEDWGWRREHSLKGLVHHS